MLTNSWCVPSLLLAVSTLTPTLTATDCRYNLAPPIRKVSAAESKFRKTAIRTISTVVMLLVFFGIIWAGATYLMLMVVGLQTLVFRELVNVCLCTTL